MGLCDDDGGGCNQWRWVVQGIRVQEVGVDANLDCDGFLPLQRLSLTNMPFRPEKALHIGERKVKLKVKLKHCQDVEFDLGRLIVYVRLDFFKGSRLLLSFGFLPLEPGLLLGLGSSLVEESFILGHIRVPVLDLRCDKMGHRGA